MDSYKVVHKEKAQDCRENLGLDIPPYGLYVYHLNAGRALNLGPALEKEDACVGLKGDYKIGSVGVDCVTRIESLGSEPEPTEVADKVQSLFRDQIEEDLPISSGEWEFGLETPGWFGNDWEYTKSNASLLDKRTFTASIKCEKREEIYNKSFGRNDLDLHAFLTTEKSPSVGHYLASIGLVPDSTSIDTDGFLTDPVEFSPEQYRDNIRTLKKAVSM
ncbi:hypothetical protein [Natronococcus wangiae]|uniref:hypothetical protein n=1 Tax=Natronococcus wangiae TaxID=3068275 RepID=UPI00273EA403|nr:hypothetical protein [Natronococcus sp. AD5]